LLAGTDGGALVIVVLTLLAGALGALLRYGVSRAVPSPWAVLVVNVVGSAIAGALVATVSDDIRLVLVTGLCGGLTTFSTLSVETVQLVLDRRVGAAALSIAANLVLGVTAAATAFALFAR
jgi:CrcB protein